MSIQQHSVEKFTNSESQVKALAHEITTALKTAIKHKGHASLIVSGGSTPLPLFKQLTKSSLQWDKVFITLADERWVDVSNEASNEHLVKKYLLQDTVAEAKFISLKNDALTPYEGASITESRLKTLPQPFDVVILGMGDDGHTASLFPYAKQLAEGLSMHSGKLCIDMTPATAPFERLSLTLPALLNSQKLFLYITGDKKWQVYQQALASNCYEEMPVRAILYQQKTAVKIFWAP